MARCSRTATRRETASWKAVDRSAASSRTSASAFPKENIPPASASRCGACGCGFGASGFCSRKVGTADQCTLLDAGGAGGRSLPKVGSCGAIAPRLCAAQSSATPFSSRFRCAKALTPM